jgi:hypothetical protein
MSSREEIQTILAKLESLEKVSGEGTGLVTILSAKGREIQ